MNTKEKILKVVSWKEVNEMLPKENGNQDLIEALESICKTLNETNKDYFYLAEFEYGEKIIENGKIDFNNFKIECSNNLYNPNLIIDFNGLNDPLGYVIEGVIEVVTYNTSTKYTRGNDAQHNNYLVLLNRLIKDDFFGIFGTLDYLNKSDFNFLSEEWDAYSGEVTFELCFPIKSINHETFKFNDDELKYFNEKFTDFNTERNLLISRKIIEQEILPKTKVVLFPLAIIEALKSTKAFVELLKLGWNQSTFLRNNQLEYKKLAHKVKTKIDSGSGYSFDYSTLSFILQYLLNASKGQAYCLVADTQNNFIKEITINTKALLTQAKNGKTGYLNTRNSFLPIYFRYEILENGKTGIASIAQLPIITDYDYFDFLKLCKDLGKLAIELKLDLEIRGVITKSHHSPKPETPHPNRLSEFTISYDEFRKAFFIDILNIISEVDLKRIHLSQKVFENVFIIKRK